MPTGICYGVCSVIQLICKRREGKGNLCVLQYQNVDYRYEESDIADMKKLPSNRLELITRNPDCRDHQQQTSFTIQSYFSMLIG